MSLIVRGNYAYFLMYVYFLQISPIITIILLAYRPDTVSTIRLQRFESPTYFISGCTVVIPEGPEAGSPKMYVAML